MKLLSWNVNGIRAVTKNIDFNHEILSNDYDIIALQETKANKEQVNINFSNYYDYWHSSTTVKGYSGTLVLTKKEPINVIYGINDLDIDNEGRVITLEYDNFYFVNVYVPNSREGLARLDFRLSFDKLLQAYIKNLNYFKPVILCGDLNVAHNEIDLKNPKQNEQNPGFSIEERTSFSNLLSLGFTDSFRYLYPNIIKYSWWSYRFFARQKGIGWRIDYFVVSNDVKDKIIEAQILDEVLGSDHCPVTLEIDL